MLRPFVLFYSFALFILIGPQDSSHASTIVHDVTEEQLQESLQKLSLEEKVGQLLIIGVNGYEMNAINKVKLRTLKPGGIILFGRNIKTAPQVSAFLHSLQKEALANQTPPLFTAIDQEGGSVTRLRHWPPLPSAAAVGRTGDVDIAFKLGLFSGQMLRALGINMNLAPVLDLSNPLERSFIGSRSFGDDPALVTRFGSAIISGYTAANVITISKHFPGHGSAVGDSHKAMPTVKRTLASLKATDLKPFSELVKQRQLPGVMLAHISYPLIDASLLPATYSKPLVSEFLRKDLGFDGLVMTDDIEMLGAKGISSPAERTIRAIEAGADMVMIAWNPSSQEKAFYGLLDSVKKGRISTDRVDASVKRILKLKLMHDLNNSIEPLPPRELEFMVSHRELRSTIDRVVLKNISYSHLPGESIKLSSYSEALLISHDTRFFESFRKNFRIPRLITHNLLTNPSRQSLINKIERTPKHYLIILHAGTLETVRTINTLSKQQRSRLVVLTSELPYNVRGLSDYKTIFFSYTRHPDLGELFAKAIGTPEPSSNVERLPAQSD